MDNQALTEQVLACVAAAYRKDAATLSRDTNIRKELSSKSLKMMNLLTRLEEELDVTIPYPEALKFETVGDVIDLAESKLS